MSLYIFLLKRGVSSLGGNEILKSLKGPPCYYLLSTVLLSLTQIPKKTLSHHQISDLPPEKCLHLLSALSLFLSIKNAKTLNQITMATSPFLIFSKTPNFFSCKSIANPTQRPVPYSEPTLLLEDSTPRHRQTRLLPPPLPSRRARRRSFRVDLRHLHVSTYTDHLHRH
ncbi:unnamed protein product [Lactuca saligna]|uniref:Uncharacterized protein n=1 Tax=Lactuca saligna TaxID=75948 RepID=A0AA35VQR6_LACSI|nr:unnamed protein product [Lactuca saligna]